MKLSLKKFIPGIAWFFILLYLMCLPGSDVPTIGWLDKIYFDKWMHLGCFALMVILFCWPFYTSSLTKRERLRYFLKIAIATSVWGLTTEFIQKFLVAGRDFDVFDWMADTAGALIALWFCKKYFI